MIFFLLLVYTAICCSVNAEDDGKCYEKLEIIHFRWTIENFRSRKENSWEYIKSPRFPIESTSESRWVMIFNHRSKGNPKIAMCKENSTRETDLVRVSLNYLGKDFDSTGKYFPGTYDGPVYYPGGAAKGRCTNVSTDSISASEIDGNVTTSGALELLAMVERLRKLPECLDSTETDLGRGQVTTVNPPITRAYHCKTNTDVTSEITYNWKEPMPENAENGFDLMSPIFPSTTDEHQWVCLLKKAKDSEFVQVYLKLVSKMSATAKFSFTFGAEGYSESFIAHEYTENDSFGIPNILTFNRFKAHLLDKDLDFNIRVRFVKQKETCEVVAPLYGLRSIATGNGVSESSAIGTSKLETANKELENFIKIKDEKIKELESFIQKSIENGECVPSNATGKA